MRIFPYFVNEKTKCHLLAVHHPLTKRMDEIRNGESSIPIEILNKIPREGILYKNRILEYVPAVYYSTHTARPFLLRGPQRGWEARGQLWRDVGRGRGGREKGAGVGRAGFSSERKGEVVPTEEARHCGGGIRGHRWAYSDTRSGGGDDKGEEEREGRAHHDTDSVLRYATMPRDCYAIWFGKGWVILGTLSLPPFLPPPLADLYQFLRFSVPGQFTRGPF